MSETKLCPGSIKADLEVNGGYQRFVTSQYDLSTKIQLHNKFVPTSIANSTIKIETRNNLYSGFRWLQTNTNSDANAFGVFKFQSFVGDGDGIDIIGFDGNVFSIYANLDLNNNKITNLQAGSLGTDGVNVTQMTSAIAAAVSGGTITLNGDVTGLGTVGTPFSTTIAARLNQIPTPTGAVSMNSQKLTNLANGAVSTDGVNVGQMTSAIAAGTITLTGNVTGTGTVGTSFATTLALRLNQILTPTGAVSMNSQKITNLANGAVSTDGVNLGQLTSALAAGTITLTGNVTGSGTVGTPFATTIVSTLNNIPVATGAVNINSQNIGSVGNLGIGVASPTYPLQFTNATSDCKIALYPTASNNFQVYGFGVLGNTLKYSVDSSASSHVFYCGASSTTSTELFRIKGTGWASVTGGSGTFYSRVPSIHICIPTGGAASNTTPNLLWTKLNATTSATTGSVQFTTSNNRITYTGSDLGTDCTGMVSASVNVAFNDTSISVFSIYKNGSQITTTYTWADSVTINQSITVTITPTMVTLSPGDYLEVWAQTTFPTTVITTSRLNLSFWAC